MKSKPTIFVAFIFFEIVSFSYAQTNENKNNNLYGVSAQFYPAGIIATLNAEYFISENISLIYRLGGNFVDRKDFSNENDNETGAGFGGSFGFRKHFPQKKGTVIAGLNLDAWNLWIDWKNDVGLQNQTSGTTYTLVLQPWLEAGYFFNLKNASSQLGFTAGFGREINTITNGKNVAQDWIASLSVQYQFTL
jgi:hypothetical protein